MYVKLSISLCFFLKIWEDSSGAVEVNMDTLDVTLAKALESNTSVGLYKLDFLSYLGWFKC